MTSSTPSLPLAVQRLLLACFVLTFVAFVHQTTPVRVAHFDDTNANQLIQRDEMVGAMVPGAQLQGRFYLAAPGHFWPYDIYRIDSPVAFATLRAALFFAEIGLLGWLCSRVSRNAALGWMVALFGIAALHLPPTFFAVLSYPTMAVGFISLLAGLHFHLSYLRRGSAISALFSGLLFLHAGFFLDLFMVFLPVFFALSWHEGRRSFRSLARSATAPITAAVAYVAAYALFAVIHPSTYAGTTWSLDPAATATSLLRQTLSVIPGYELFAHRTHPAGSGPWLKSAAEIRDVFATTPIWAWGLALLQGVSLWSLVVHAPRGRTVSFRVMAVALACALLANLPMSLTERYQIWAYRREFPYIYSFYTYCALVAFFAFAAQRLLARSTKTRPAFSIAFAVLGLALFSSAAASNAHTLNLLRAWHNPSATAPTPPALASETSSR